MIRARLFMVACKRMLGQREPERWYKRARKQPRKKRGTKAVGVRWKRVKRKAVVIIARRGP